MYALRDEIDGAEAVGTLTASDCVEWLAAGDDRTDEEKARDAAADEWRRKTPSERARVRREEEKVRRARTLSAIAEESRALDAADTSGCRIPRSIREPLGRTIYQAVRRYMSDPAHRADFEAWYLERYGRPYDRTRPGKEGTV